MFSWIWRRKKKIKVVSSYLYHFMISLGSTDVNSAKEDLKREVYTNEGSLTVKSIIERMNEAISFYLLSCYIAYCGTPITKLCHLTSPEDIHYSESSPYYTQYLPYISICFLAVQGQCHHSLSSWQKWVMWPSFSWCDFTIQLPPPPWALQT